MSVLSVRVFSCDFCPGAQTSLLQLFVNVKPVCMIEPLIYEQIIKLTNSCASTGCLLFAINSFFIGNMSTESSCNMNDSFFPKIEPGI